jgi:predicted ATPase/DNA-binding winged helix-turn-helix (wHTH) protein
MDEEVFAFGSFRLLPAQRMLSEDGKPVRLGGRALDILTALTERAGDTISKEELIARAWPDTVVEEAALRVHIAALRKALGDDRAGKRYIANHPGRGYAFVAPVTRENAPSATAAPTGMAEAGNLPAPIARVVGRGDVISRLAQQLVRRRFITIVGPGGIGKTTVAVAIAGAVCASYSDGAWYVELASLSDPDLVPSALCTLLGIAVSGVNPLSGLAAWLRDKHILIVLHNCEHVIGATAALAKAILKAAPHAGLLAIAREPLRAEGEWLHRLPPLELPPQGRTFPTAAEALGYSAVELFNERAAATTNSFMLNDADVPAVLEICRRLDGVPLALELAAARVDTFGVRGLAARLDDRFSVLTSGRRTALPHQRTLRATIDWSYDLLPEPERRLLRCLAAFAGGFTLEAIAEVAERADLADVPLIDSIANLVAKSLVVFDASASPNRWRVLETIRAYAFQKLAESGEREVIAKRHARHYRDLFKRAEAEAETTPMEEWLAAYRPHIDNPRAALQWAFHRRAMYTLVWRSPWQPHRCGSTCR